MTVRALLALGGALVLTGCSYGFDLRAIVLNGRIAFVVAPNSPNKPDCVQSIHVETRETARARPAPGDDAQLVAQGIFWWKDYAVDACPNAFPILYGQALKGRPFVYDDGSAGVEAKPLQIGVVYEVQAAGGGGYGTGRFRIRPDRTVENLPIGPDAAADDLDAVTNE